MRDIFQKGKEVVFQNLANAITAIGIIMTICLISLLFWGEPSEHRFLIFLLAVGVGLSDLDGFLARYLKTVMPIGAFLDKFRDKFFACSVFAYFLHKLWHSPDGIWTAFIKGLLIWILIIEFFLICIWFYGLIKGLNVNPHSAGKAKTDFYFIGIGWWFCLQWLSSLFQREFEIWLYLGLVLFLSVASVCGILSIAGYLQRYNKKGK